MTDFTIEPAGGVSGDVEVPGDKSIGHRAVLFAALADGACEVTGLSGGEDKAAAELLAKLGQLVKQTPPPER